MSKRQLFSDWDDMDDYSTCPDSTAPGCVLLIVVAIIATILMFIL